MKPTEPPKDYPVAPRISEVVDKLPYTTDQKFWWILCGMVCVTVFLATLVITNSVTHISDNNLKETVHVGNLTAEKIAADAAHNKSLRKLYTRDTGRDTR